MADIPETYLKYIQDILSDILSDWIYLRYLAKSSMRGASDHIDVGHAFRRIICPRNMLYSQPDVPLDILYPSRIPKSVWKTLSLKLN